MKTFYDLKTVPVSERESFNNTILLLTMVKSQYYYIIGFSRPDQKIRVGFDYENEWQECVSETLNIDFGSSEEYVKMQAVLETGDGELRELPNECSTGKGKIYKSGDEMIYECIIPKDKVIPTGIHEMNDYILAAKKEIGAFLKWKPH